MVIWQRACHASVVATSSKRNMIWLSSLAVFIWLRVAITWLYELTMVWRASAFWTHPLKLAADLR